MGRLIFLLSLLLFNGCSVIKKKETYSGYGSETVSPEVLAQFAPKPLSFDTSRKIQTLLDVRAPGMGMIHPDGKRLFFSWRVTGMSQVWRLDRPEGFPVQVTGGEDPTNLMEITPDGKFLILSRDRNGEENPGLYLQPASGGPLFSIQHVKKVQTIFEMISDDSNFIYFRANDVDPESYAIYRYSIKTQTRELVFSKKGYWTMLDQKPDGRLLLNLQISNSVNEVYEFNPKSKELKPLFGQNEKTEYQVLYGPAENTYFVITPEGEYRSLFFIQNGKRKPLAPGLHGDVVSMGLDRARTHLAFASNIDGYTKLTVLGARDLQRIKIPIPKETDHTYAGWQSRDGRQMMVGVETAQAPRQSFSFDFQTRKLTRWVVPSVPEVDLKKFVRAESEFYTARDGTKIPMFVRRPPQCASEPCPVVVNFHGGPEGQSVPGFSVFAQMYIDEGFIFVEPNVRGSEGYGQTWLHLDDGAKRLQVVTDIEDCATFIKKNWAKRGVAPKVGVMGGSYGGYSTLYAMTKFAGSYDAGVAIVGMSNLLTFLQNTAPYRRALRVAEYGDPVKDREALLELSPSTYLTKLKDPLLIIQGAEDPRVPVGEAVQFYREMEAKNISGGLILFSDEGHGAQKRSNQVLQMGHALAFFKKHLQGM